MTAITLRSDLPVELIQHMGSDEIIAAAARASTGKDVIGADPERVAGLIGYLLRNGHTSPFEHTALTLRVQAPIFVFREMMRHRVWAFNELSARYAKLEPHFYAYPEGRPLVQAGSGAHPKLIDGDNPDLLSELTEDHQESYQTAWDKYERSIERGAALEVARAVLPVGVYSTVWGTVDVHNLMGFLRQRTTDFGSGAQWEIEQVARQIEAIFAEKFPDTYAAYDAYRDEHREYTEWKAAKKAAAA